MDGKFFERFKSLNPGYRFMVVEILIDLWDMARFRIGSQGIVLERVTQQNKDIMIFGEQYRFTLKHCIKYGRMLRIREDFEYFYTVAKPRQRKQIRDIIWMLSMIQESGCELGSIEWVNASRINCNWTIELKQRS